ncbi:MAG: tRNA uridine-5-carboxymethylaminomethyl(34) synthesis GTPase MnmE [Actinobacteria bacterium]|nr:tRNA uridine-5-carboxymethylaminomethyl(34) synthesis GTPase MnmE [Actinomycetota bacterium]
MIAVKEDTIAAIGTRAGEAAIGIVRVSGDRAIEIVDKIFRSKSGRRIADLETYTIIYGEIVDKDGSIVDEAIVSLMRKPKSYTREDVVEINCHGGVVATTKTLELCIESGARLAEPGEFTMRAFLNGRIDLSQAEAVLDLIRSKTEQSLKIAAQNLKGKIREEISRIRSRILEILAQLEASIDFIEEDLEILPYEDIVSRIGEVKREVEQLIEDEKRGEILKNGVKAAIAGKPNVGKSSLLNVLSRKDKAIVTPIPGTTRDAIEEILYVEGIPLILVDTAGIRKTKNIIERLGVERSLKHIDEAEITLLVLDGSKKLEKLDLEIMSRLKKRRTVVCINKIDLSQEIERDVVARYFEEDKVVEISALKGVGIPELEKKIRDLVMGDGVFEIEEKIILNSRHKSIMMQVERLLGSAVKAMKARMSEEFPSLDLRAAYNLLGEVIGERTTDDVLNMIFSQFCIGK